MPTKNPRLTITISPSLAAQLRRMSELTGNSQSALIVELLEGSGPVFDRLIKTLEAATAARSSITGAIGNSLDAAQVKLEKQLGLYTEIPAPASRTLLDDAEVISRRGTRPAPISNRGVRYPKRERKVITNRQMPRGKV